MKISGIILIVISSILSSIIYERKQKEKLRIIEEILSLISTIKTKISYLNLTIDDIFSSYKEKNSLIDDIKNKRYTFLENFDKETRKEIVDFFECIGKGYKKEQISSCEYLEITLNNQLTDLKADVKNKIRIFRAMTLFVCGCIIIFLI